MAILTNNIKLAVLLLLLKGGFLFLTAEKIKFIRRKNMKVLIGTKNPGKIEGARRALRNYYDEFEIEGISAPSNVSDQPVDEDIYFGARNRVNNLIKYAKENNIEADYYMAVESGITNRLGKWVITNVAVIKDKKGYESIGTSASFPVPNKHVDNIIKNTLGTVMDDLFNESDLRSSTGGVGLLTHEVITRIDLNTQAFVMALTQFVNKDIWRDNDLSI